MYPSVWGSEPEPEHRELLKTSWPVTMLCSLHTDHWFLGFGWNYHPNRWALNCVDMSNSETPRIWWLKHDQTHQWLHTEGPCGHREVCEEWSHLSNTQHIRQNRPLRYFSKVVMPRNLDIFSGRFCQEWSYGVTKWAIEMLREKVSMTQNTTKTHFLWSPPGSQTHIKHICLYGVRSRFLKRSILSMTAELKTHFQSTETGVLPSQRSQ